jgi:hypothetical protein
MYPEVLEVAALQLCKDLDLLKDFSFYLAGGTGLALQLSHRRSFDLDFFTPVEFDPPVLESVLSSKGLTLESSVIRPLTLYCLINKVKVSFMFYDEMLLFPLQRFEKIEVAHWKDILVEKLRTIADRGRKRDFYDVFFGLKETSIEELCLMTKKKFQNRVNYWHILKGLSYFEDADKDPAPMLLKEQVPWQRVKAFFIDNIKRFEKALL